VLESPDRLRGQAAHFGEMPGDGKDLVAKGVFDCVADALRHGRLELGGGFGEGVESLARARERRFDRRLIRTAASHAREPPTGPFESVSIHGGHSNLGVGWDPMRTAELDYDLPRELIAQRPLERRDESRLLVFERTTGAIRHRAFRDLPEEVGDSLVVVNDTRVLPARLRLRRDSGGEAEVLLLESLDDGVWEALARPSRRLRAGMRVGAVEFLEDLGEGRWHVRLDGTPAGEAPLPPYITEPLSDPERYQTVYAEETGSAAAPTAGLHFTRELLGSLDVERVTLHVGLDTFRPITAESLAEHELHSERYRVDARAWDRVRAAKRVAAVGTTTVRVLESLARGAPLEGRTRLFIAPGFHFRRTDVLLTNFHLPRSSLLALVMAFAGVEETRRLYRTAIDERYRFYSFGDAMLVL
jgi:S-adenosylmethionine:tRNA ribosyltransferase-isomerase